MVNEVSQTASDNDSVVSGAFVPTRPPVMVTLQNMHMALHFLLK